MKLLHAGLLAVVLAACSAVQASSSVVVTMSEFEIDVSVHTLSAGTVQVRLVNDGEFPHTLVVEDTSGAVIAASEALLADSARDLELELPEGRYRFTCRIVVEKSDGEIVDHYEQGMLTTVDVVAGS